MSTTPTTTIMLPGPFRAYVAQPVESGEYSNGSEHVRDRIRSGQREPRVQRLRALIEDGLASGTATADTPADWSELEAIARGDIE